MRFCSIIIFNDDFQQIFFLIFIIIIHITITKTHQKAKGNNGRVGIILSKYGFHVTIY